MKKDRKILEFKKINLPICMSSGVCPAASFALFPTQQYDSFSEKLSSVYLSEPVELYPPSSETSSESPSEIIKPSQNVEEKLARLEERYKRQTLFFDKERMKSFLDKALLMNTTELKEGHFERIEDVTYLFVKDKSRRLKLAIIPLEEREEIDRGAFGEVFAVYDLMRRLPAMALKKPVEFPEDYKVLTNEMRCYSKFHEIDPGCRYIAKIYLSCSSKNTSEYTSHLIMKKEEGNLGSVLYRLRTRLEKIQSFKDLLEFLVIAKKAGVIHCDLKINNILFYTKEDGSIGFKICDFGTAIQVDMNVNSKLGSWRLICPKAYQAIQTAQHKFQIDMYCIGVIMFNALSGKLFKEEEDPTPIVEEFFMKNSTWPKEYFIFFQKALAQLPERGISPEDALALWVTIIEKEKLLPAT